MDSSSACFFCRVTDQAPKRPMADNASFQEYSKRPRLQEEVQADEEASHESCWSHDRGTIQANLSILVEASDCEPENPESATHIVAASRVTDLERHVESLATELEAWSLLDLKEWRKQQESAEQTMKEGDCTTTRQRQNEAKRTLMRNLSRQQNPEIGEVIQEGEKQRIET